MNKIAPITIGLLCCMIFSLRAQTALTAGQAVEVALKNNYDVLIAKNNYAADSINDDPGNAGMLPFINFNAGYGINQNNINQKFVNGNEIRSNNAGGTSLNAGVALNWTLFDGTKMFITKNKLETIRQQGELEFKSQILQTTTAVLQSYYGVVYLEQLKNATNRIIAYNEDRIVITTARVKAGTLPKTDLLQAQIELNTLRQSQLELDYQLLIAKQSLNALMGRDVNTTFQAEDTFILNPLTDRKQLEDAMYNSNPGLLSLKTQFKISEYSWREARASYSPRIDANAGYNYTRNQNTAGFSLFNQAYGWNAGITLALPIYNAGQLKRETQLAALNMLSADAQFQQARLNASLIFHQALNTYDTKIAVLNLEKESNLLAKENMELSLARLKQGQTQGLEVASAQVLFTNSTIKLYNLYYEAKVAEINVYGQAAALKY